MVYPVAAFLPAAYQLKVSRKLLPCWATAGSFTTDPNPAGGVSWTVLKKTASPGASGPGPDAERSAPRGAVASSAAGCGPTCTRGSEAGRPAARAAMPRAFISLRVSHAARISFDGPPAGAAGLLFNRSVPITAATFIDVPGNTWVACA